MIHQTRRSTRKDQKARGRKKRRKTKTGWRSVELSSIIVRIIDCWFASSQILYLHVMVARLSHRCSRPKHVFVPNHFSMREDWKTWCLLCDYEILSFHVFLLSSNCLEAEIKMFLFVSLARNKIRQYFTVGLVESFAPGKEEEERRFWAFGDKMCKKWG